MVCPLFPPLFPLFLSDGGWVTKDEQERTEKWCVPLISLNPLNLFLIRSIGPYLPLDGCQMPVPQVPAGHELIAKFPSD